MSFEGSGAAVPPTCVRVNGYFETSFLPGRSFTGPADFNAQLSDWVSERANMRQHRTLGCRPADRWDVDRDAMLALPPVAPLTGWSLSTRLLRDHYVRLASNDCFVYPSAIGRRVHVTADLTRVRVTVETRLWWNSQQQRRPRRVPGGRNLAAGIPARGSCRCPAGATSRTSGTPPPSSAPSWNTWAHRPPRASPRTATGHGPS